MNDMKIEMIYKVNDMVASISLCDITEIVHRETIRKIFDSFKKSSGWGVLYHPADGKMDGESVLVLSIYLNLKGITFISRAAMDEILCQNDRLGGHIINLRNLNDELSPLWHAVKRTHRQV